MLHDVASCERLLKCYREYIFVTSLETKEQPAVFVPHTIHTCSWDVGVYPTCVGPRSELAMDRGTIGAVEDPLDHWSSGRPPGCINNEMPFRLI